MNTEIEFEFLEPPRGKERPRLCIKHGKKFAFTPKFTRMYEKRLGDFARKIMEEKNLERFGAKVPLECSIHAFYPIPASKNGTIKLKMVCGKILPTKPPDCDNILKIILDALNGVCYEDDAQICNIFFFKYYNFEPKIIVKIRKIKYSLGG